jgi:tetratricopeptide (TPR) repeat protein
MAKDHQDRIAQAKSLLQKGAAAEAAGLVEPVVADDPDVGEAWSVLGAAYFELEDWQRAEEAAREVVRLEPRSARAWSNLGTILRKQLKYDAAVGAQEKALSLDRNYGRAEVEISKVQDKRGAKQGWKIRTPDGDYLGPVSIDELQRLVRWGEVEPKWNARQGSGRVTSVRDALGPEVCDEALRGRSWVSFDAETEAAEPQKEAEDGDAAVAGEEEQGEDDSVIQIRRSQLVKAVPILLLVIVVGVVGVHRVLAERAEVRVRKEALSAVRDLADATSVGVVYLDYRRRVIDARQSFRRAYESSRMPEAEFWGELEEALHDYENAADHWAAKIDADDFFVELQYESRLQKSWADAGRAQRKAHEEITSDLRLWPALATLLGATE